MAASLVIRHFFPAEIAFFDINVMLIKTTSTHRSRLVRRNIYWELQRCRKTMWILS